MGVAADLWHPFGRDERPRFNRRQSRPRQPRNQVNLGGERYDRLLIL